MPYFQYIKPSESKTFFRFAWEESQVVDVSHPTSSSGCRSSMDLQAKSSSSSSVNINKEDQDSNFEIFKSNYQILPNYLRSSLDYCSLMGFRGRKELVKFMLAEGLVEEKAGEILEDTASNILQQLISLGMIQEQESSFLEHRFEGPSIKVVNHYRKLSVVKVDKQDFLAKPQDSPISYAYVHVKGEDDNPLNFKSHPIRFLFMQHRGGLRQTTSIVSVCYSQFLLMLNLVNYLSKSNYLPDQVGDLVHLRYLRLEFIRLKELPQTLGNLRNLQTLEVGYCQNQLKLPVEVLKIQNLRHLKISNGERFIVPIGIDKLVNLYTCWGVCPRGGIVNELSRLTQLRELGITHVSEENISEILVAIMKMENLVSLSLQAEEIEYKKGEQLMFFPAELETFSPPPLLQELHLDGGLLEMPNWLASMVNLTRLSLYRSNLSENPSLVLQFLPELKYLYLGSEAYNAKVIGKEFCSANGFPKLEALVIWSESLIEWTEVLDGAFPNLRSLNLEYCWELRFLPEGLQNITTLENLYLHYHLKDLARLLKGEENYKIEHISKVYTGRKLLNEDV